MCQTIITEGEKKTLKIQAFLGSCRSQNLQGYVSQWAAIQWSKIHLRYRN